MARGGAQCTLEEHDEKGAAGVLQKARGPGPLMCGQELRAREHEEEQRETEFLRTPPGEQQRAGQLDAGERHHVRYRAFGEQRLQAR